MPVARREQFERGLAAKLLPWSFGPFDPKKKKPNDDDDGGEDEDKPGSVPMWLELVRG